MDRYTQHPRPTLWLLPEGEVTIGGDSPDAQPAFQASVRAFYIAKTLITNEQFAAFRPSFVRSSASPGPDAPAVGVSFRDAVAYCEWYAALSRKAFRLPTEIEWEYACRGGTTGPTPWGADPARADRHAWHAGNSLGVLHDGELLAANPFGVHDLLGLAWEWTASLHRPYPAREGDGRDDLLAQGPRAVRGGSFRTPASELRSGARRSLDEAQREGDLGFRIVRSL